VENSMSISFETGFENLSIVVTQLEDIKLDKSTKEFEQYEQSLFQEIRSNNHLEDLSTDPFLQSYRSLHWTYGIDPTKKRGSSEAVLRRILQGENLWRISNLVDIVNLASAYHKIPIGLIDTEKSSGQLTLRTARAGEVFQRIGGEMLECRGREIVLTDDIGIVCYGFAIHDSDRTKITSSTKHAAMLHYGSKVAPRDIILEATNFTLGLVKKWVDCKISEPVRYVSLG